MSTRWMAFAPAHVGLLTLGLLCGALAACRKPAGPSSDSNAPSSNIPEPTSQPAAPSKVLASADAARAEPAARVFGAAAALSGDGLDVAQVLASPEDYVGQTIRCTGTVARVCQRKGCWLELRPSAGDEGLRVPMAGHSFFVPQDIVGRRATVEGELAHQPLQAAQRAHLEGEGLAAVGPLSLNARSVTVY